MFLVRVVDVLYEEFITSEACPRYRHQFRECESLAQWMHLCVLNYTMYIDTCKEIPTATSRGFIIINYYYYYYYYYCYYYYTTFSLSFKLTTPF